MLCILAYFEFFNVEWFAAFSYENNIAAIGVDKCSAVCYLHHRLISSIKLNKHTMITHHEPNYIAIYKHKIWRFAKIISLF